MTTSVPSVHIYVIGNTNQGRFAELTFVLRVIVVILWLTSCPDIQTNSTSSIQLTFDSNSLNCIKITLTKDVFLHL